MIFHVGHATEVESGKIVPFEIRNIDLSFQVEVDELQNEISEDLGKRYIPAPSESVEVMLEQNLSLGLFIEDKLEGIRLVYDRRPLSEQLRAALQLPPEEESDVAQLSGVYVRSRFAKNRLGLTMTRLALDSLRAIGRRHIFATVAPQNVASLKNLAELGFVVRTSITLDDDAERYVLYLHS